MAEGFLAKMKARHPHLYDGGERQSWEGMKAKKRESIVDGLPADLPALHRAFRLQDRAAGVGFDWPDADGPAEKVEEELAEVREEVAARRDGRGRTACRIRGSRTSWATCSSPSSISVASSACTRRSRSTRRT